MSIQISIDKVQQLRDKLGVSTKLRPSDVNSVMFHM